MNIQDEAYSEAMDEIKRWKVQHEEMLLKHAREQHVALSTLDEAMDEIERLKDERDEWKTAYSERFENWKALLIRAADALETSSPLIGAEEDTDKLIAELRKAAQ